jgi:hypothetical protein
MEIKSAGFGAALLLGVLILPGNVTSTCPATFLGNVIEPIGPDVSSSSTNGFSVAPASQGAMLTIVAGRRVGTAVITNNVFVFNKVHDPLGHDDPLLRRRWLHGSSPSQSERVGHQLEIPFCGVKVAPMHGCGNT